MSIRLGSRIVAGGGSNIREDDVTITKDANDKIQSVGNLNKNTSESSTNVLYDWVGTLEEYDSQDVKNEHPEWICYITDDEEDGICNAFTLLDFKWSDHQLNDVRWVRSDTFSWQDGSLYSAAFQHLVNDIYEYNVTLFCWASNSTSKVVYTKTETPTIGDYTYDENGNKWKVINSVSSGEIDVQGAQPSEQGPYIRNSNDDIENVTLTLAEQKTETISGKTITYYLAQDGHKIALPDQENDIVYLYENIGIAWYYILDVSNHRFKLPRTKFSFTGLRDTVGKYVEAGLPNITGTLPGLNSTLAVNLSGAFSTSGVTGSAHITSSSADYAKTSFNASNSNSIYGNSTTVQSPATQMYLYFYMGDFSQKAEQNTNGVTTEILNQKADLSMFQVVTALPVNPNINTFYFIIDQQ